MLLQLYVTIFALVLPLFTNKSIDRFSDEFINLTNCQPSARKTGENLKMHNRIPRFSHANKPIPESFDAREHWPECADIIGDIQDQGDCNASWAISAVSAMSDRLCIHSKGKIKVSVSAEDVLSCCMTCHRSCKKPTGLSAVEVWRRWIIAGFATGGGYNTTKGCKAYSFPSCDDSQVECKGLSTEPSCSSFCDDGSPASDSSKRTFGKEYYKVPHDVRQIQLEIMKNGPVQAILWLWSGLSTYKSGIYQHGAGKEKFIAKHSVKIFGWGIEAGTPYWHAANANGIRWGDKGFFKIRRGYDECGIESDIYTGLPKLNEDGSIFLPPDVSTYLPPDDSSHSCSTASFINNFLIFFSVTLGVCIVYKH